MDITWWLFFAVGISAQLVDGALGMAFGVTATSLMLSFGTAPAQASALVHIAEVFTTAASGASHYANRNIDWSIVRRIAIPGAIGGVIGATVLSNVDGKVIAPIIAVYLAIMGIIILLKAARKFGVAEPSGRGMRLVGFTGGVLDAIGGGGWGPIVTSTLVGTGHVPRYVIGSVNLTEFLVTVATTTTFFAMLGTINLSAVVPLVLGGLAIAPFAGYLTRYIPARPLMVGVGCLILFLSGRTLIKMAGWI
jgi:uncharacterized membrane protein YfcA